MFRARPLGAPSDRKSAHASARTHAANYHPYSKPNASASTTVAGSPKREAPAPRTLIRLRDEEEKATAQAERARAAQVARSSAASAAAPQDVVVSVNFRGVVRRLGIPEGLSPSELTRVLEAILPTL